MAAATCELILWMLVFTALNSVTSATFDSVTASFSRACQITVDNCKGQAISFDPSLYTACTVMSATVNGVTASQCLVQSGFCTEIEFVKLKNAACNGSESEQQTVSPAKTALYTALGSTSEACKRKTVAFVRVSPEAVGLKQSEKYCDLFQSGDTPDLTKTILTARDGCSDEEFNGLKQAACSGAAVHIGWVALKACLIYSVLN